ncbi:hypothetical protein L195_g041986 [Trifolium pratense]|uniref:Uncharacterized protein n=1 Tax=Trifolium pratense TaxID=57577 RepID=A0A2K3M547_TRIPR|nr:hypothetical protein L195_g041986 [Trifolium pratense]
MPSSRFDNSSIDGFVARRRNNEKMKIKMSVIMIATTITTIEDTSHKIVGDDGCIIVDCASAVSLLTRRRNKKKKMVMRLKLKCVMELTIFDSIVMAKERMNINE